MNLTLKEFELLCLLLDNPGVVFTRDQLLNRIWGYSFDGESRTVDVHVRHLRQKLGTAGSTLKLSAASATVREMETHDQENFSIHYRRRDLCAAAKSGTDYRRAV